MKQKNILIKEPVHKRLKVYAAENRVRTLSEVIEILLEKDEVKA